MISPATLAGLLVPLLQLCLPIFAAPVAAQPLEAASSVPFRFIAVGDAGDPGEIHRSVAARIVALHNELRDRRRPSSLLLFLGDNFYPVGLNRPLPVQRWLVDEILTPYRPVMAELGRSRVHAVTGNHDYYCTTINLIPRGICRGGNEAEAEIPDWTYHLYWPQIIRNAVESGSRDSVDIITFDSSLLLAVGPQRCRVILDSMERILKSSAAAPSVKWRLLAAHHSPYSIGEHGGWRRWMSEVSRIGYIGNCIADGDDPFRYVYQAFSNQDNCSPDYQAYVDTLIAVVDRSGAKIHAMMAGHDHSLQLMYYPERNSELMPKVFVISGAGSKRSTVKPAAPPREFTHPINTRSDRGLSIPGFVLGSFENDRLVFTFYDNANAGPLDMGNGRSRFEIDRSGALLPQ